MVGLNASVAAHLSFSAATVSPSASKLTIRNGFTHYPQKQETYRFFRGNLVCPERIIMLDGSGSISFDVLAWLSEQRVSLIQITWNAEVSAATRQIHFALIGNWRLAKIQRSEWSFAIP
jgi:hypothetical protein